VSLLYNKFVVTISIFIYTYIYTPLSSLSLRFSCSFSPDELLAGYTPFYGKEPNQIHREITRYTKHYPKVSFPKHFTKHESKLCLKLLHPNPSKRLGNLKGSSNDVKLSSYFKDFDFKKLLNKKYKPEFIPSITDSYDLQNFQSKQQNFEKTIDDDDPNFKHEEWANEF